MVKFIFAENYWGIQLDGATGKLLHIERRRSDIIEKYTMDQLLTITSKRVMVSSNYFIQPSWDLHFYYLQSQDSGSGMDLRG
jgi:hypothetical protein